MGDHRASIKITFEMHGEKSETDMWINWWPDEMYKIDKRVIDFFENAAEKSMNAWWDKEDRRERARIAKERAEERELYEQLKAKFGD